MRIRLEPEATASVAGRLGEADFARLESKMKVYDHPPATIEEERQQRVAELEFHELLVGYCPNPLMTFACRFLLSLLKNLTICRRIYGIPNPELREHGRSYQLRLMSALRKGNAAAARQNHGRTHAICRPHDGGAGSLCRAPILEGRIIVFRTADSAAQSPGSGKIRLLRLERPDTWHLIGTL